MTDNASKASFLRVAGILWADFALAIVQRASCERFDRIRRVRLERSTFGTGGRLRMDRQTRSWVVERFVGSDERQNLQKVLPSRAV